MCIAIVSPAGVKCPTLDTLKTCFLNNDDGAGWAYPLPNGRGVKIMKGFMTWKDFSNAWTEFGKHYDTEALPLLIHFRISTGAGVVPSMTHPFPINYDDGALQKITYVSDYAVIHNGIISCVGYNERPKHLSDTAVFCKEYLPLMVKMSPDWLHHDETMQLIHKMIDSKMAIMDKTGFINMTEGFEEWEGNFYSNTTYKENRYRSSKYRAPQNWYHSYDDDDDYDDRRRSRYDDDYDDRRKDRYDDRRKKNEVNKDTKKIMKILMVVAGVVIALLIMFLVGNAVGVFKGGKGTTTQQTDSEMVKVPDVTGKTYEEAQKELNKYDLGIHKSTAPSDTVAKGKIISQDPADGKKVKKHTTVNVVISSGEEAKTTTIPNVVGMSEADAEKALQAKNLVVKKGDPVYSDNVEQGEVVSVSPSEGAEVKEGTTVTLVISKGNQPATVPKLTGKSQSDAEAALSQAGLSGNATEDYSDTVEEGVIISQDTDAGKEVSKGTTIGYVVSKGPKMTVVTVPDLSYKDKNTAEKLLKQAGLTPEYIGEDYSDEYPKGQVFYQSVSSGTQVEKGTTVKYMVSKGSQPSAPDSGNSGNDSGTEENTNQ